ncbi:unnamed protein product [Durusdinium trenchii]|uniref:Uncharacterized protein n=1 Tax=Durusdinium trenchii TaxID=1381693 RepID=A0ABP0JCM1_9DINO
MPSASYAVPPGKVIRTERSTVQYVSRSLSPGARSGPVWPTAVSVPIPVLTFGTPPRTPRVLLSPQLPGRPFSGLVRALPIRSRQSTCAPVAWRSSVPTHAGSTAVHAARSTQVLHPSTDEFKARRHSAPLQTSSNDDVENQGPRSNTDMPRATLMQQAKEGRPAPSVSSRSETLSSCPSHPSRVTTWTSPLMTSRQTQSASLFSTPQLPQRSVRKSEALRFFPASAPLKAAPSPSEMSHMDRIRSEMMKMMEERERCHQKQLQLMQEFQQAREREHQHQLQHMRESHKADMQRLEEKLSELLQQREVESGKNGKVISSSVQASSNDEEEDTLQYTEPSIDHTLSPIAVPEVDCSPDATAAAASPLLSEASFPSSAILGSESSPLSRTIKMLPPHLPQVPMLPKRSR